MQNTPLKLYHPNYKINNNPIKSRLDSKICIICFDIVPPSNAYIYIYISLTIHRNIVFVINLNMKRIELA